MVQDGPTVVSSNREGLANSSSEKQVGCMETSMVAVMVPTTDLVVTNPLAIMKEYLHSYSVTQAGIPSFEASTFVAPNTLKNSLYDNLREKLKSWPWCFWSFKQKISSLIDETADLDEHLSSQRKCEFRELAPLLVQAIETHTELKGNNVSTEALSFEVYQLDAKIFESRRQVKHFVETLEDDETHIEDLPEHVENFDNSTVILTQELEQSTLRRNEAIDRIQTVRTWRFQFWLHKIQPLLSLQISNDKKKLVLLGELN